MIEESKKNKNKIKVLLANPRGFCAGVERAIEIFERALKKFGPPIYFNHELVHNQYVINDLNNRGAIFVKGIQDVPPGSVIIFSAHGVSSQVENDSKSLDLKILDATCPLVKKVHNEIQRHDNDNKEIVLIGHKNHPEVEGTMGRVPSNRVHLIEKIEDIEHLNFDDKKKIAYVTQTTLSIDDTKSIVNQLKSKYNSVEGQPLKDICYATQNRQDAVKALSELVDVILVIGSKNSSNSNRLRELGASFNIESYLIDSENDIDLNWFNHKSRIGITAGASAPDILLNNIVSFLQNHFDVSVEELGGVAENIKFKMPKELQDI